MPESPQLAPFQQRSSGSTPSPSQMAQLPTPSLRENPATLLRKLILAACTRDLVLSVRVETKIDWWIESFAFRKAMQHHTCCSGSLVDLMPHHPLTHEQLGARNHSPPGVGNPPVSYWEPWPQSKRCWTSSLLLHTQLWTDPVSVICKKQWCDLQVTDL